MKVNKEEIIKMIDNARNAEDFRKIKKLASHNQIKLQSLRKKFCKHCHSPDLEVNKITKLTKTVKCKNCGKLMRWSIT